MANKIQSVEGKNPTFLVFSNPDWFLPNMNRYKISGIRVTLGPLVPVWLRSTNTIPWVWVNTMGVVNTMGLCLFYESMSVTWVHVYTMIQEISNTEKTILHKFYFQKYRNTIFRNTEIYIITIHQYKVQKYGNTSTEIVEKYKWQKYKHISYRNTSFKTTSIKLQKYRNTNYRITNYWSAEKEITGIHRYKWQIKFEFSKSPII